MLSTLPLLKNVLKGEIKDKSVENKNTNRNTVLTICNSRDGHLLENLFL